MNIKSIFSIGIVSIILLSISCKTSKPIRPEERYNSMKSNNRSTVNIPVQLNLNELERTINREIDGLLYEDKDLAESQDGLMIKASKNGDIKLGVSDHQVRYKVPLSLWIKKSIGFTDVEAEGEITLDLTTQYEIDENWTLNTTTSVDQYEWQRQPVLKLGFVELPIGMIGNAIVNRSKVTLAKLIDRQLKENFILKEYVTEAWRQVQKPVLISKEHQVWVKIKPYAVSMTPIATVDSLIKSTIAIESLTEVIMGEEPSYEYQDTLPPFSIQEKVADEFRVNLFTQIPFARAEEMAKKYIVGETFQQKGQKVKVENLDLYGQGDKIVVNASLSGSYNGSVYMIGRPEYNEKKNEIEVKDLKYELSTKNYLHKSLAWLFKKNIEKKLVETMKFPLEANLQEIKGLIQQHLEYYEVTPNIVLKGELDNLDIGHTVLNEEAIQVIISSKGRLNLELKNLEKIK